MPEIKTGRCPVCGALAPLEAVHVVPGVCVRAGGGWRHPRAGDDAVDAHLDPLTSARGDHSGCQLVLRIEVKRAPDTFRGEKTGDKKVATLVALARIRTTHCEAILLSDCI